MEKKLTVIIADGSEQLCQQIAAEVQQNENFTVVGLAYDGKQATELVRQNRPDILVLDMMLPERDGIAVLRDINGMETKPTVIATSSFVTDYVASVAKQLGIRYLLVKPFDKTLLVERMVELTCLNTSRIVNDSLRLRISETLYELGVPTHIRGFQYLHTAISMVMEDEDLVNTIIKDWYRQVAKDFNTTPARVERAIQHAKEVALEKSNQDILQKVFGTEVGDTGDKLGNREFILAIVNSVRLQMDNQANAEG